MGLPKNSIPFEGLDRRTNTTMMNEMSRAGKALCHIKFFTSMYTYMLHKAAFDCKSFNALHICTASRRIISTIRIHTVAH